MTLDEYIVAAKAELDEFANVWRKGQYADPEQYPAELGWGDWEDQELAERFGIA